MIQLGLDKLRDHARPAERGGGASSAGILEWRIIDKIEDYGRGWMPPPQANVPRPSRRS